MQKKDKLRRRLKKVGRLAAKRMDNTVRGIRRSLWGADLSVLAVRHHLKGYGTRGFLKDGRAGLNVALVAIPQGLAYASIAGLPIQFGVYGGAVAAIVAALLTTSRHTMLGPTNATSITVASAFGAFALDQGEVMPLFLLLVGGFLILGAILRMANLIQYMSRTVVIGYITGAAILIVSKQVHKTLGVSIGQNTTTFFDIIGNTFQMIPQTHGPTLTISLITGAIYILFQRYLRGLPNVAITLILATLTAQLFAHLDRTSEIAVFQGFDDVALFNPFPLGWPVSIPAIDFSQINVMVGPALAVAFLCSLEGSVMNRTISSQTGDRVNNNQEMFTTGIANVACAFLSGQPASGSLTRSALNFNSGAVTQLAGLYCGILCALAALVIGQVVGYVPVASLSVLVIAIAISLFNWRRIKIALRATPSDATVLIVTLAAALITRLDTAIFIGVGASIALYLRKAARPSMVEYEFDAEGGLGEKDAGTERQIPQISIVHAEGELFFGAADVFRDQIQRIALDPNIKVIILRMRNARNIDATSVMALEELHGFITKRGSHLLLSGVRRDVFRVLRSSRLLKILDRRNVFLGSAANPNLSTRYALIRAKELMGDQEVDIRIFVPPKREENDEETQEPSRSRRKTDSGSGDS